MRVKTHDEHRGWLLTWSAILVGTAVVLVHNYLIRPWMLDDAFISFRYAENFVNGHGLVFNPGERVEGYTNFLWVILLACGKALRLDIVLFSKIAGGVFAAATLVLVAHAYRFSNRISRTNAAIAALFLGTSGVFSPWVSSGMEALMFTFALLLAMLAYVAVTDRGANRRALAVVGAVCGLTALIRPEGVLVFAVLFLHRLIVVAKKRFSSVLFLAGPFALIYGVYFSWRLSYYGFLLPNTYYAKVGFGPAQARRGLEYLRDFALVAAPLVVPFIAALVTRRWGRRYSSLSALPILLLVYTLYVIAVGGDVMPAYRFFAPILPLICLMGALAIGTFKSMRRKSILVLTTLTIVGYNLAATRVDPHISEHIKSDTIAYFGEKVGRWLRANADPDAVVATNTAGTVPFFSKLKAIDMLGMNDVHIAHRKIEGMGVGLAGHEKGDGGYILSRRPNYIILGPAPGTSGPVSIFLSDVELYRSPEFHQLYELHVYRLDTGQPFTVFERRSGTR